MIDFNLCYLKKKRDYDHGLNMTMKLKKNVGYVNILPIYVNNIKKYLKKFSFTLM